MEKRNSIVLTAIAIATLLVSVVGASFAFFTASIGGGGNANNEAKIKTAAIAAIDYSTSGSTINLENAYPGAKGVVKFMITVKGDPGSKIKYVIRLTPNAANTLTKNVKYTLYSTDSETNKIEVEDIGVSTDNGQFKATDKFKTTGSLTPIGAESADISTDEIVLQTNEVTVENADKVITYYLALEYFDIGEPQDDEQGTSFTAKVSVGILA